jgi:phosphate transport system protein
MVRTLFTQELSRIQDETLMLGSMVNQALWDAMEALKRRDHDAARDLIANDRLINQKRYQIEEDCLSVIATQQPMAGDVRLLAAVLEITTELERIGDYAKGIGRIILLLDDVPFVKPMVDLRSMCTKALDMLRRSLDAFVRRDVQTARLIPAEDDEIDALYNQVHQYLIAAIMENPAAMDQANYLLWAAHNLERAGDRVTNICERIIYTATGELVEFDMEEDGLE